jgi:tetratricopeptide (TPR) repeat protein
LNADVLFLLGKTKLNEYKLSSAINYFTRALQADSLYTDAYILTGQKGKACPDYRKALKLSISKARLSIEMYCISDQVNVVSRNRWPF